MVMAVRIGDRGLILIVFLIAIRTLGRTAPLGGYGHEGCTVRGRCLYG